MSKSIFRNAPTGAPKEILTLASKLLGGLDRTLVPGAPPRIPGTPPSIPGTIPRGSLPPSNAPGTPPPRIPGAPPSIPNPEPPEVPRKVSNDMYDISTTNPNNSGVANSNNSNIAVTIDIDVDVSASGNGVNVETTVTASSPDSLTLAPPPSSSPGAPPPLPVSGTLFTQPASPDGESPSTTAGALITANDVAGQTMLLTSMEQVLARAIPMTADGRLATFARELSSTSMLTALAQLENPAVLVALPSSFTSAGAALAQFVRVALASQTPAEYTFAAARFNSLLGDTDLETAMLLLTQLAQNTIPGIALAATNLHATVRDDRPEEAAALSPPRTPEVRSPLAAALPQALPALDAEGRPYTKEQQDRLRELALDPRSGFAPEGCSALEAEERYGLRFVRCVDGLADFTDAEAASWQVMRPRTDRGLAAALERTTRSANVIVDVLEIAPRLRDTLAAIVASAHAAQSYLRRVVTLMPRGV